MGAARSLWAAPLPSQRLLSSAVVLRSCDLMSIGGHLVISGHRSAYPQVLGVRCSQQCYSRDAAQCAMVAMVPSRGDMENGHLCYTHKAAVLATLSGSVPRARKRMSATHLLPTLRTEELAAFTAGHP